MSISQTLRGLSAATAKMLGRLHVQSLVHPDHSFYRPVLAPLRTGGKPVRATAP